VSNVILKFFYIVSYNLKQLAGFCLILAFSQMGYRLSPQFSGLVVSRYDPQARQRLTLDNFIQACVMLKTVTDTFRQKDAQQKGVIQIGYEEFLTMVLLNKP